MLKQIASVALFLLLVIPVQAQVIKSHAAALSAGSFEDVTSLIHGTYLYGSTNTASGKIETYTVGGTAVAGSATYLRLAQSSTSGSGTGATFTVSRAGGTYSVTMEKQGYSYAASDTITILGTSLGGASPTNNLTITVSTAYGFITFPSVPEGSASSTDGTYAFSHNAQYSWEATRHRIFFQAGNHASPGFNVRTSNFMIDLDNDTLYDISVPQWVLSLSNAANLHNFGMWAESPGRRRVWRNYPNSAHVWRGNLDEDDPRNIDSSHWTQDADLSGITESSVNRGTMVHFPDRRSRIFFDSYNGVLMEMKDKESTLGSSAWSIRWTLTGFSSSDGTFNVYNPVKKCIWFGGGGTSTYNHAVYKIDAAGTLTPLTNLPVDVYTANGGSAGSFVEVDPISGLGLIMTSDDQGSPTAYRVYTYNFDTDIYTRRTDIETALASLSGFTTNPHTFQGVIYVSLPDLGVFALMSPAKVWLFKLTANTRATGMTYAEKLAFPGVLHPTVNLQFNNETDFPFLRVSTNANDDELNYAASKGYTLHPGTGNSNVQFVTTLDSGVIADPHVVTDVFPPGSTGSLRFDILTHTAQSQGFFSVPISGVMHDTTTFISPLSDLGMVFHVQYYHRVNSAMLTTNFRQQDGDVGGSGGFISNCSTASAGGKTIVCTGGSSFDNTIIGRMIGVISLNGNGGTNTTTGVYGPISSVPGSGTIVLDSSSASPTPSAAGTGFIITVEGTSHAGGWKQEIVFGNAPYGTSSNGSLECTTNNGAGGVGIFANGGYPQEYGRSGTDAPAAFQSNVPYRADDWMLFQKRIEMKPEVGSGNIAGNAQTDWFVDGVKADLWTTQGINWSTTVGAPSDGGDGWGQIDLLPFQTRKDGTQSHSTGYMWFGDLIMSTEPIPAIPAVTTSPSIKRGRVVLRKRGE